MVAVGASLTALMLMVAVSEPVLAPPEPVLPPSLASSVSVSLAGGRVGVDDVARRGAQVARQQVVDLGQRAGQGHAVGARAGYRRTGGARSHRERARDHRQGRRHARAARIHVGDRQPGTVQGQAGLLGGRIGRRGDGGGGRIVDRADVDGGRVRCRSCAPPEPVLPPSLTTSVSVSLAGGVVGVDDVAHRGAEIAGQQVVDLRAACRSR